MLINLGDEGPNYEWLEDWADVPEPAQAQAGWAHHGLAVTRSGEIVAFHPARAEVVIFDRAGHVSSSWPVGLKEGHGITLVEDDGDERLWLADPGTKMRKAPDDSYQRDVAPGQGQVVKFGLDGTQVVTLARPSHAAYETGFFAPTSVAVNETRHGGNGDVWVADGYGESLVHRYSADGRYLSSLSGEEGPAGRFNCPHAVFIDRRPATPEVWVADRGNARVQVYDTEGHWLRTVGEGFFNSPSAFATDGSNIVVGELFARLAVVDTDDRLVGYLGEDDEAREHPGWPNGLGPHEHPVRNPHLHPGHFNSPHGLASDSDGNLYVAEWLIGGRMIKLGPVPEGSG
jgi:DNA-binding beta-propeller fold protein YncE